MATLRACILGACLFGACAPSPRGQNPLPRSASPSLFEAPTMGIAFEMPPGWEHQAHGPRHLFSGPLGQPTHYTTVTLQIVPGQKNLDDALHEAYAQAQRYDGFAWDAREPTTLAGTPALRYAVRFDWHEKPRRKVGVIFTTPRGTFDLSLGAPADLLAFGLPEYEDLLHSVSLY